MAISAGATEPALVDWVEGLSAAGVESLQVREKGLNDRDLLDLVDAAVRTAAGRLLVLVNGRCDVALAAGADGVHLPSRGVPTIAARRLLGDDRLLGRSTHTLDEIRQAAREGADYVTYGPIFETPGKGAPVGLEGLSRAAALGLPVLALGGLTPERCETALRSGATGLAAIRMFQGGPALEAFRRVLSTQ